MTFKQRRINVKTYCLLGNKVGVEKGGYSCTFNYSRKKSNRRLFCLRKYSHNPVQKVFHLLTCSEIMDTSGLFLDHDQARI